MTQDLLILESLPSRERELKPSELGDNTPTTLSLPSRERELKLGLVPKKEKKEDVAPLAGA